MDKERDLATATLTYTRSVAWQKLGDETVVLDVKHRTMLGLDPAGSALWKALGEGLTLAESVTVATHAIDDPPASLSNDLQQLVHDLLDRGLLSLTEDEEVSAHEGDPDAPPPPLPPCVAWEEPLEAAGVFAACGKDPFEGGGPACDQFPGSAAS